MEETILNTELSGLRAITAATTAIKSNVTRSATILSFLSAFFFRILPKRSEDTAEEARTVSGEKVKAESSRWYQSPFAWIIGIGVLAAVILLIYHKNKENRDGKR